ncbi:MAG: leucine--tRNA ligase [Gammaproteobacteria bacterium]
MTVPGSYPFAEVEAAAQRRWAEAGVFDADENRPGEKFYCLSMFPYPSGRLHMGHVRNYTIGDMIARHRRMLGCNVLQPLGWDAFGLPAENAAIDNNIPPARWTRDNIAEMRGQLQRLGLAIDWRREHATCDAEYYRWEQQFFVRLFRRGLIYKKKAAVNWDPVDNTVLANEQVVDGCGWRSGAPVERREIPMYFMKITDYADELLADLDALPGWPESVKTMQRNWLGRSEGVRVFLAIDGRDETIECWSTRPDTLFGASFCALAPEHPLAAECAKTDSALADFIASCRRLAVSEAALEKAEKRGLDTGLRVIHPFDSARKLPVYVANFILAQYGSGAIYGCPAHDQRDLDFARRENLPVTPVVLPPGESAAEFAVGDVAYTGGGTMINSAFLDGLPQAEAIPRAISELEKIGRGARETQYRLRDWGVSRQRYWGCPIPIIRCPQCGDVPVPEKDLPVRLPEDAAVDGRGSPLAKMDSFVNCSCPECGAAAARETDTLDTFFESSWYFSRFASYDCDGGMTDRRAAYWMPVDQYVGGIEHACLHLLYARFFHKLMRDAGMYPREKRYDEPFANLLCQGMVLNTAFYRDGDGGRSWIAPSAVSPQTDERGKIIGGKNAAGEFVQYAGRVKMSKSAANGVDPESLVAEYGADTARLFILFAAPPEQSLDWSDEGVRGCARFLNRLWRSLAGESESGHRTGLGMWREFLRHSADNSVGKNNEALARTIAAARLRIHEILAKADYDMNRLRFNNIPSAAMSIVNELEKPMIELVARAGGETAGKGAALIDEGASIVLRLLAPAVPHIAQALWQKLGFDSEFEFIADAPWPRPDSAILAARKFMTLAVQINGKRRGEITVAADSDAAEITKQAREIPAAAKMLAEKSVRKTVVVPGRIVNFVV